MNEIEKYYNKFNEDKRLKTRHGQVEFFITSKYIKKYLKKFENPKILDIGAGTGAYSIPLANKGYDVSAVELVKHNLRVLEQNGKNVKAFLGNALNLKKFEDESFDIVLLLGPMYHLFNIQDKLQALLEAKRVCKNGGYIFVAYVSNDYAIIKHGFVDGFINSAIKNGEITKNFLIKDNIKNLYSYSNIKQINALNKKAGLKRKKIIGVDGATDYIRPTLNKMDEKTFEIFLSYQSSICERKDLLGASSHILDILQKNIYWQNM